MDISSLFIQAGAVLTGVGRVAIKKNVAVSRVLLASSMGLVTSDYLLGYMQTYDPLKMVGALTFGVMFTRTLLLATKYGQRKAKKVAAGAFLAGTTLAVSSQLVSGSVSPATLLSVGGLGFGCYADYQNTMRDRRACFFIMGMCSMGFATLSGAWPLFVNNLVADIITNGYFINKYDVRSYGQDVYVQKLKKYLNDVAGSTLRIRYVDEQKTPEP